MIRGWSWTAGLVMLLSISTNLWSRGDFFLVKDLRPGMKGTGKTCFEGSKPEEFQVEILGVLRGMNPGSDAVLARFSGGHLEKTGVFEGMSGTPVYIDGKLLGAIAFSFSFSKEAIGGITPITEMVSAFVRPIGGDISAGRMILKKSMLWDYQLPLPESENPTLFVSSLNANLQPELAPFAGHALTPIATPLSLGGFSQETIRMFGPQFQAMGLTLLKGAGLSTRSTDIPDTTPIEPGSNIVVPIVRGDFDASVGGTVTHIDGDKLYAFGHMLFNLGFTELPMHKGRAMTVLPNVQSSFKIVESTDPIGTILQDRGSGVFGVLGQKTRMVPMTVQMTTSRGVKKVLNYEIARDRYLTPLLINLTVFNSIVASERSSGVMTLKVKGEISIKGEKPVEIESRFSSESNSPIFASLSVAVPVNFLMASGYENLELEKIDLDITALEDDRAAILDSIRSDRSELHAGEVVNLKVLFKKTNGEVIRETFPVKVPQDVTPGTISMLVADGTKIMAMDSREQGDNLIPSNLTQLIKFMNNIRKNDRLYVRLFRRETGAVINGEGMPGLPPSVLSILQSDRTSGGVSTIHKTTYMEYEFPPYDYLVSGSKTLSLEVKP